MTHDQEIADQKRAAAWGYVMHRRPEATPDQVWAWLYLADVNHLHRWGRLVSETLYVATEHGPRWAEGAPEAMANGPALLYLSQSDESALQDSLTQHGRRPVAELRALTQDAAWQTSFTQRVGTLIPLEALARLSPDPEPLLEHLRDPHPGSAPRR